MQSVILTLILLGLVSSAAYVLFGLVSEPPPLADDAAPESPDALPPVRLHPLLEAAAVIGLAGLFLFILVVGFSL